MVPHLRPGCPLRDVQMIREEATWSHELGRWRLPETSSTIVALPPASKESLIQQQQQNDKSDLNNNDDAELDRVDNDSTDLDLEIEDLDYKKCNKQNIADVYFKRNRIDKILAHAREAKTFGKNIFYHYFYYYSQYRASNKSMS